MSKQVLERFKKLGVGMLTEVDGSVDAETQKDIDRIKAATCIEDAIDAVAGASIDMHETFSALISAVNEPGDDKPEWYLPEFDT